MNHTTQNNFWPKLVIFIIFIGCLSTFFMLGGDAYISLESIKNNRNALLTYSEQNYPTAMALAILIYAASTALSIPGATVLSLTLGFLFGRWIGTTVILFAATLGATLVFLAVRYLFAESARKKLNGGMATKLLNGFNDNALHYLLFLRLVPLFPFWLVNIVPAFTTIKTGTYVLGTAIGILPGCFILANLGQSLGRIDSLEQLISDETLLAFALLGLFPLLPIVINKFHNSTQSKIEG